MKKLLSITLLTLILLLSGCGEDTPRQICLDTGCTYPEENTFYTSAEVDEMLEELNIDIRTALATITVVRNQNYDLQAYIMRIENELYNFYYTQDQLDEGFEDIGIYVIELEAIISALEQRIIELENK